MMPEVGFDRLNVCISNGITRTEFAEEHPEATSAWFALEKRAHEYIGNNVSQFASRSSVQDNLNVPNQEAAEFVIDFRYNGKHSPNQYPASLTDVQWTEERIEGDKAAIRQAAELGAVPEGWESQVNYQTGNIQEYYEMAVDMG